MSQNQFTNSVSSWLKYYRCKIRACCCKEYLLKKEDNWGSNIIDHELSQDLLEEPSKFGIFPDAHRKELCVEDYITKAISYTRKAEVLAFCVEVEDTKRYKLFELYNQAAEAWLTANERENAGRSYVHAAFCLQEEEYGDSGVYKIYPDFLLSLEKAVEIHVPDDLNRFASFRKTKSMIGIDFCGSFSSLSLARSYMSKAYYARNFLAKIMHQMIEISEYRSALYCAGAISALLEIQVATMSLHRAYLTETILHLYLKDIEGAEMGLMEFHIMNESYSESREFSLSDDLVSAFNILSQSELDIARQQNCNVISKLNPALRLLIMNLNVSEPNI